MLGSRDDELSLRWLQLGVFSPIMRLHSSNNEFLGKEPWNYNMAAEKTMTEFLQLRHKLIPYLYTMNHLTHREGLPLVRPMYYHHDVPQAYDVPNEFWFGTEMIVCPITKPVDPETLHAEFRAWLPEGEFFDFFTGQLYRGGRTMKLYRNLETIPVLVKAGGIVPMAKDFSTSHLHNPEELEVHVFNGADGTFDLYEDQGGEPVITRFRFTHGKTAELCAEVQGDASGVIPENRRCHLVFRGMEQPTAVSLNGMEANWCYDADKKEVHVTADCGMQGFRIGLELADASPVDPDRKKVIYNILHRAQVVYAVKSEIYEAVCQEKDVARVIGRLHEIQMPEPLQKAVLEQILAIC